MSGGVVFSVDEFDYILKHLDDIDDVYLQQVLSSKKKDAKDSSAITSVSRDDIYGQLENSGDYTEDELEQLRKVIDECDLDYLARRICDQLLENGGYWEVIENFIEEFIKLPQCEWCGKGHKDLKAVDDGMSPPNLICPDCEKEQQ